MKKKTTKSFKGMWKGKTRVRGRKEGRRQSSVGVKTTRWRKEETTNDINKREPRGR